jgi:hypothetical protein
MNSKSLLLLAKKYPFSAVCAILCVLLVGLYYYRGSGVEDINGILAQKTSEARRIKTNINNSAQLGEHVELLRTANEKIGQRLMRESDLATNQQYFYKIEAETGIKITDLQPGGAVGQVRGKGASVKLLYPPVPYTCAVQGNYGQILQFLRKLESGDHFMRVTSATISLAGGASDGAAVSADPLLTLVLAVEFLGQS